MPGYSRFIFILLFFCQFHSERSSDKRKIFNNSTIERVAMNCEAWFLTVKWITEPHELQLYIAWHRELITGG